MGETELDTTWKFWADLQWCSFCTRVNPRRTLVDAHEEGDSCPSRGKNGAVFQDPFVKAFAAVKGFQEAGGLEGLRARDPDVCLGKECLRAAGLEVSDSESEDGFGLDSESESDFEGDADSEFQPAPDEGGMGSSSSSAVMTISASASAKDIVGDAADVDQNAPDNRIRQTNVRGCY